MSLSDWAVCPESSCESGTVVVDTVDHGGGHVFVSFHCESCEYGSLEDDFRWWVRCPECMDNSATPIDSIEYDVTDEGKVYFECTECGYSVEEVPESKWSSRN